MGLFKIWASHGFLCLVFTRLPGTCSFDLNLFGQHVLLMCTYSCKWSTWRVSSRISGPDQGLQNWKSPHLGIEIISMSFPMASHHTIDQIKGPNSDVLHQNRIPDSGTYSQKTNPPTKQPVQASNFTTSMRNKEPYLIRSVPQQA